MWREKKDDSDVECCFMSYLKHKIHVMKQNFPLKKFRIPVICAKKKIVFVRQLFSVEILLQGIKVFF